MTALTQIASSKANLTSSLCILHCQGVCRVYWYCTVDKHNAPWPYLSPTVFVLSLCSVPLPSPQSNSFWNLQGCPPVQSCIGNLQRKSKPAFVCMTFVSRCRGKGAVILKKDSSTQSSLNNTKNSLDSFECLSFWGMWAKILQIMISLTR